MGCRNQEPKVKSLGHFWGMIGLLCLLSFIAILFGSHGIVGAAPALTGAQLSTELAEAYLDPSEAKIEVGDTITLAVRVGDVKGLYGVQYKLHFDPNVLEVVDADGSLPGVQIHPAEIFEGRTTYRGTNSVDNAEGVIQYAVMINPIWDDEPVNGPGVLGRITFQAKGEGSSRVRFIGIPDWTALSDREANPIPATWRSSMISVGTQRLFLPLVVNQRANSSLY